MFFSYIYVPKGVNDILFTKSLEQERSIVIEATCYTNAARPSALSSIWNILTQPDVLIKTNDGSAPVRVHRSLVLHALPKILDVIKVDNAVHSILAASESFQSVTGKTGGLVDLTDPTVELAPTSQPQRQSNNIFTTAPDDSVQEIQQSTRSLSKKQTREEKRNKRNAAVSNQTPYSQAIHIEEAGTDMTGSGEDTPVVMPSPEEAPFMTVSFPSTTNLSSLDISSCSSGILAFQPSSPQSSPPHHSSAISNNARALQSGRGDVEIWIWPETAPAHSCEQIMRWVYLNDTPSRIPLSEFDSMLVLLIQLDNQRLVQSYLQVQRHFVRSHTNPLVLLTATDYNSRYSKALLRPVLQAAIRQKWPEIVTCTTLELMMADMDPSASTAVAFWCL
ncbi:hypothetical protein BGX28_009371 [Mortierella sp. GBA30]|nr:hypothetical protein BGX28_009371 [Mortierella sp. GBA30]